MKLRLRDIICLAIMFTFALLASSKSLGKSSKIRSIAHQPSFVLEFNHPYDFPIFDTASNNLLRENTHIRYNQALFENLKRPRYVEKIGYYEDQPSLNPETEVISIKRQDETYYRPFVNKLSLLSQGKTVFNCASLFSPFECQENTLCGWDNSLKSCYYVKRPSQDIRFKQQSRRKLKHINI